MDLSSHAQPLEAIVQHLDWTATVDFDACIISGEVTYTIQKLSPFVKQVHLDTSHLRIQSVRTFDGLSLKYTLHAPTAGKPHLGQKFSINLPQETSDTCKVTVVYQTTDKCSAVQWLPPAQTAGGKHPYLFSQCQAIHARTLLPCQDSCGIKMTYKAIVTVPGWATCVMSALLESQSKEDGSNIFTWNQPVPISTYLFAIAVGDIVKKDISKRCAIWSEPGLVDAAAYDFAETEEFLKIAEDIAGKKYVWGRYDLLCLPPSFPYGGMENPCLTFVTPTLLAGDRSLADVVAHEIAHSWTGNLVTNATWDHFWLNEGWTTWFQRKIMASIKKDPKFLDFDAIGGRKDLQSAISQLPEGHTKLVLDIGDEDPDESYSTVAYEKGFTLLLSLERRVGSPAFEKFFKAYVERFMSQALTTNDFKLFFMEHFKDNKKVQDIDWQAWFYSTGMPPELPPLDKTLAEASQNLAELWLSIDQGQASPASKKSIDGWSSLQITCFLDALQVACTRPLKQSTLKAMNDAYKFSEGRNSEILFRYCQLAIEAEDSSILPVAIQFITTQGRMKFVRPLYRALYNSKMGGDLAVSTFLQNKDFYHPICVKMISTDLKVGKEKESQDTTFLATLAAVGIAAAAVAAFAVLRRKK